MSRAGFPIRWAAPILLAALACPLLPNPVVGALAWPGESWSAATNLTSLNPTGWASNLSGAYWDPDARRLWVCTNNPAKFWALRENGLGGFVIEREYAGTGDLEGITRFSTAGDRVFVLDEQARTLRSYRVSDGAALTTWLLSTIPDWGNSGPEGIAFVPDAWLAASGFVDGSGAPYPHSVHGGGGFGGVLFVAVQTSGWVYAFDLRTDGTYTHVGRYLTSRTESCELTFDASTGTMFVLHNTGTNYLETTALMSMPSGGDRRFVTRAEIQVPSTSNIEGFAATPALTAANAVGDGWCFFTDDDNASGALRWFRQLHPTLQKVAGDGQTGAAGTAVSVPPSVLVLDPFANPLPGFPVTLSVTSGGGSVTGGASVTGVDGVAGVGSWILGSVPGQNTLTASGSGLSGSPQVFTAQGLDLIPPSVAIEAVSPDPRGTPVEVITIVFSEPITGFELADLILRLDGGTDLLAGASALATNDRMTWTLDTSGLTSEVGTYGLTLSPDGIQDDAGNSLAAGATESWLMEANTSVEPEPSGPAGIRLDSPLPNPGWGSLLIPFALPSECTVEIVVYDLRGRRIATVAQGTLAGGAHRAVWNGRGDDGAPAASGVYFYRLRAGGVELMRRGFLLR